jgi:hypothetical protein
MNVVGAPRRVLFTLPVADVVGASAVNLAVQPPTGTAFDRLAVLDSTASGINSYHADITSDETTAGGIGLWRVMPKIAGADAAAFPKYDDAALLDFELQWDSHFNPSLLLSVTELREHVTTSLVDSALARIIDAEEAEIVSRFGAHASQVETFEAELLGDCLFPKRPVLSVTSIIETITWPNSFIGGVGSQTTTMDASDYEIMSGGKQIRRLASGTHWRETWGQRVVVTYVPIAETAKRVKVLIDLCALAVASKPGMKSESQGGGEYSYTAADLEAEREKILARLGTAQRNFA